MVDIYHAEGVTLEVFNDPCALLQIPQEVTIAFMEPEDCLNLLSF